MKVYKLEVMVIDHDELGPDGIREELENADFANHCIHPAVKKVECRDIGEWSDDHPLNIGSACEEEYRRLFEEPSPEDFVPPTCGRCYAENVELFPATCNEKPEERRGEPIGMYHCPDCGAMLIAGLPHPTVCALCRDHKHPGFDELNMGR